jgi:hypothetical protein
MCFWCDFVIDLCLIFLPFMLMLATVQCGVIDIALRSVAWTFTKRPFRRYNPPPEGQHAALVERPLSVLNVLLDALDLICNKRGIGWSWSHKPFPKANTRSTSIPVILAKLLIKLVALDASHYLMQHLLPSVDGPAGDTIFDPALSMVPRCAWAAFSTVCGAVAVYTFIDASYHIATLIGRILLRQSAWQWPPISNRPWLSTSITEFWSFRWHQIFRYVLVTFGSRPGAALLGRAGALMGAFAMSAVLHDLSTWGLGQGTEFRTVGGFFLLMGVGVALEHAFKVVTGRRVGGIWGWMWTMVWTTAWGTLVIDAWVRRGTCATADSVPDGPRPGKLLVDAIISLSRKGSDIYMP